MTGLPLPVAAFTISAGLVRRMHRARPGQVIGIGLLLIALGDGITVAHMQPGATGGPSCRDWC